MMKKMLLICSVVTAVAITGSMTATAALHKHTKAEKVEKAPALQELTVTGTVEKIEKQKKGEIETKTVFRFTDADGNNVILPKGEIAQYVGKKVTVIGQGFVAANGTKHIKTITRIEKAEAPPLGPVK